MALELKKVGSAPHHDIMIAGTDSILIVVPEAGFKDTADVSRLTVASVGGTRRALPNHEKIRIGHTLSEPGGFEDVPHGGDRAAAERTLVALEAELRDLIALRQEWQRDLDGTIARKARDIAEAKHMLVAEPPRSTAT